MSPPWLLLVITPPAAGPTYTSIAMCPPGASRSASRKASRPPATHGDELFSVKVREKVRVETAYVQMEATGPRAPGAVAGMSLHRPDR
jgi:hypothetical protein